MLRRVEGFSRAKGFIRSAAAATHHNIIYKNMYSIMYPLTVFFRPPLRTSTQRDYIHGEHLPTQRYHAAIGTNKLLSILYFRALIRGRLVVYGCACVCMWFVWGVFYAFNRAFDVVYSLVPVIFSYRYSFVDKSLRVLLKTILINLSKIILSLKIQIKVQRYTIKLNNNNGWNNWYMIYYAKNVQYINVILL